MKAARLLSALLLLQSHGRLTGRELAERLEVSQRTIHRDMEALISSRIPIVALRGAQGGWELEKGWQTKVPGLDEAELRALLMAQPQALGNPRLAAAAERAFNKLVAALPGPMRQQAAAMRERLHVDPTGWYSTGEDMSMLAAVQDAVAQDRRLSFDYRRADGQSGLRTVDPLGLVAKGASWYLVARAPHGLRTYRVSRMQAVTMLASAFERPAGFHLAEWWKQSTDRLEQQRQPLHVTLALAPEVVQHFRGSLQAFLCNNTQAVGLSHTWAIFEVEFESEEQARFVAKGLGSRGRVIAPASLREHVLAEAAATQMQYVNGLA